DNHRRKYYYNFPSNTVDSSTTPSPSNTVDRSITPSTSNTVDSSTTPSESNTVDSNTPPSPEDGSTITEVTTSTPLDQHGLIKQHIPSLLCLTRYIPLPVSSQVILITTIVSKETTETDHKNIITSYKDTQTVMAHLRVSIVSAGERSEEEIIEALHNLAAQVQAFLQGEYCKD
ncbi:unnamed protein product, partial [Coregonus sp. 'balchen']